jgi:nitroimidazol reductase NimA-like FMN-containing flavoprotein (pyridoxamine 5'-phosphate oxidase superfamily)
MVSLHELAVLDREQSLALLRKVNVGRLVFTEHALPAVQPVDFRWWRGDVVIRVADPAVLAAASGNRVVAFETDELDGNLHRGWSVTIVGRAQVITDAPELLELSGIFSRPWIGGRRDYFVRIRPEKVTGRRVWPEFNDQHSQSTPELSDYQVD